MDHETLNPWTYDKFCRLLFFFILNNGVKDPTVLNFRAKSSVIIIFDFFYVQLQQSSWPWAQSDCRLIYILDFCPVLSRENYDSLLICMVSAKSQVYYFMIIFNCTSPAYQLSKTFLSTLILLSTVRGECNAL